MIYKGKKKAQTIKTVLRSSTICEYTDVYHITLYILYMH